MANDLVVLFTDGLFEVETAEDDYYGADRLLAAVRKRMHLAAGQLFGEVVADDYFAGVIMLGDNGHRHGHSAG